MQGNSHPQSPSNFVGLTSGAKRIADLSFLEMILEDMQDGVYVYAADTLGIRYMNAAARARHGWTAKDLQGKSISDTAGNFDREAFFRNAAPLLAGERDSITLELVHSSGPIEVSTKLVKTRDEGDFFVSLLRDISARKSSESDKVQTVSTVSHELRTPLTSIHGALRLLRAGAVSKLDDKAQDVVDIAARNTDRLLSIVNDILDLEKINSNKMDFSTTEMDIVDCLEDTVELVSGSALESNVRLDVHSDLRSAMVRGNADRICQVITNFASNAIKYSPEGATVAFRLSCDERGIVISVSDEGPGISSEQYRMLFKPFSQVRAGDGSKRPGTGLGLAIVAAILKRLEYPIEFTSAVGKGSTFAFRVPSSLVLCSQTYDSVDKATA